MTQDGIIRVGTTTGNYHIVHNEPANDERLSWEARGIMSYLLSKPDGWVCRNKDLENRGPAKKYKIKKCLKELRDLGYLTRHRENDGDGHFTWVTKIYESPSLNPTYGGVIPPSTENQTMVTIDRSTIDGKLGPIVNTDTYKKIYVPNGTASDSEEGEKEKETKKAKCLQCHKAIVDDGDLNCSVCKLVIDILVLWGELFPKKTQPRPSTYREKIKARMKSGGFRKNWREALTEASKSPHLHQSSWFQFRFFVQNDEGWRKCLEHYYASFDQQLLSKNGRNGKSRREIDVAWQIISKAVLKYGRHKKPLFSDDQITQAVSNMGWNNICDLPDNEGKRMFGEIFSSMQQSVQQQQIDEVLGSSW